MSALPAILQLLKAETPEFIDDLYEPVTESQGSFAAQLIFQSLSSLAQQLIIRLLYLQDPVPSAQLEAFLPIKTFDNLLHDLVAVRVLVKLDQGFLLNSSFQTSLQLSVYQPYEPWSSDVQTQVSSALIEKHCADKWQEVLYYILTTSTSTAHTVHRKVHPLVESYVLKAHLLVPKDSTSYSDKKYVISNIGYNYILKDYVNQVWDYTCHLILVQHSANKKDTYDLFFKLAFARIHAGYRIDKLTTFQQQLVYELSFFGLLYLPSTTSKYFYLTHIASHVLLPHIYTPAPQIAQVDTLVHTHKPLHIIVETNMQVIAYIHSDLQFSMVKLFVDVNMRLPNMAIGRITREKSREAFLAGITAAQVIDFLLLHAHPVMKKTAQHCTTIASHANITSAIPDNVIDQLILWENETQRITTQPAIVADFREIGGMSRVLFQELVAELEAQGGLVWTHPKDAMLGFKPELEGVVQGFIRKHVYKTK
ncbi:hypothetical protein EON65_13245 [archaeon]|nr:MAG: hypothetical protein EON65_13245 [archaeon]